MLPDFDKLWNYSQPAETEKAFRQLLSEAEKSGNPGYLAELLTQIARAQGLQNMFTEAHTILDRAESLLSGNPTKARVRYLLERGRVFNSSGQPERAMPFFVQAYEHASAENLPRYAIDAAHMIAIVEPDPARQVEWNLKGIEMARADASQRGWLGSLYNNIAESYALLKEYQTALDYIRKLLAFQKGRGKADMYTLKDEARFLRLTGHADQSLPLIEKLAQTHPADPWIQEELAASRIAAGIT